jgi:hypothetical protein
LTALFGAQTWALDGWQQIAIKQEIVLHQLSQALQSAQQQYKEADALVTQQRQHIAELETEMTKVSRGSRRK